MIQSISFINAKALTFGDRKIKKEDLDLTNHTEKRGKERNFDEANILNVMNYGEESAGNDGATQFTRGKMKVVAKKEGGFWKIITGCFKGRK